MPYARKVISVIGLARSGFAAAKLLLREGARVFVSDSADNEELRSRRDILVKMGAEVELGGHTARVYCGADEIILSPGIPPDIPILLKVAEKYPDLPIISEIELGFRFARGQIIAITGSNGKSTTTSLTGELLKSAGIPVSVCGNIGKPFCEAVLESEPGTVFSLELSSFQLEQIESLRPEVACLLNLSPDHLDRYDSPEDYYAAKMNIFENQIENDMAVLSALDERVRSMAEEVPGRVRYFGAWVGLAEAVYPRNGWIVSDIGGPVQEIVQIKDLGIRGEHNLSNACAALACVLRFTRDIDSLSSALKSFSGLPHRLELIAKIGGVEYINDSKATNVDALECALRSFDSGVILIAGGYDKGADFEPLAELVSSVTRKVILIGDTAERIASDWNGAAEIEPAESLEEAVKIASQIAQSGDVVLLAPGCASFDMFENFEKRGEAFAKIVHKLEKGEG